MLNTADVPFVAVDQTELTPSARLCIEVISAIEIMAMIGPYSMAEAPLSSLRIRMTIDRHGMLNYSLVAIIPCM